MNNVLRRRFKSLLAAALLLIAAAVFFAFVPAAAAGSPSSAEPSLSSQVRAWMDELAREPAFSVWRKADYSIEALGPGTHGWMVHITVSGKPAGYMIVSAAADGTYRLGEYGEGGWPLFSARLLRESLMNGGLAGEESSITVVAAGQAVSGKNSIEARRLYVHPLLAVWRVALPGGNVIYADAMTAELLPIGDAEWNKAASSAPFLRKARGKLASAAASGDSLRAVQSNGLFDPYDRMPWLSGDPAVPAGGSSPLKLLDKRQKLDYTAELYSGSVLYVWPACGYHQWSGDCAYIAFGQSPGSVRYVLQSSLKDAGSFYRL